MSFYALHTTHKSERDILLAREGELIEIPPSALQLSTTLNRAVVIEEEGKTYIHPTAEFLELCKDLENEHCDPTLSKYYEMYSYKIGDVHSRVMKLRGLIRDIRQNGIKNPVHVEITGERLDGSFRTKIAMYLGIPTVKAILHRFTWQDISEDFIERKLRARSLSSGKDYYEFEYGYKDWKNVPDGGPVYRENALERWKVLEPLIKGKVLDLGCNEGYMSLMAARNGHEVVGYDLDWNHIAYLNKLIFEFIDKKDLKAEFIEADLTTANPKGFDTILMLNVLYHLPRKSQVPLLKKMKGKNVIFQCNLRKERERETYYGSHPDDLKQIIEEAGLKVKQEIAFKDKPIIIAS